MLTKRSKSPGNGRVEADAKGWPLNTSPRILFAGTPAIAVPVLEALAASFPVVAVLTNPDRPGARSRTLVPSPVKEAAATLGLPVLQPESLRTEARDIVSSYHPDMLVCFAYGKLFGPRFLSLFSQGAINIHPSRLPMGRGSSPIQYTILSGDAEAAISIQRIAAQMDSGDILAQDVFPLDGTETTGTLTDIVALRAAPLAVSIVSDVSTGKTVSRPQSGEATYTHLITKDEALLDWSWSIRDIHCCIRAFHPWPKAWTTYEGTPLCITSVADSLQEAEKGVFDSVVSPGVPSGVLPGTVMEGRKGKGIAIACGNGIIWIDRLQLSGRKEMAWQDFINGNSRFIGSHLGG
ncbi:methionyl-tRNA formyltransferase [Parasphaerochaeta coccoides]|uniref:Methionyl-tRNA formyltransferase n=1 Tax=Parasphaerochaeta coccoides (strain ATCC BAA-1237 / DSM 17374 / SPN1) TaxID=760011 RepID=F4GI53_PARC1|nr:methionyl-tRNA formyltransferase [Parasphaerochaeta coccoides]AEC02651.1 Methionyl-tRNA formyltransferase [Parasphaerochaeta coccoides DSM 17374]